MKYVDLASTNCLFHLLYAIEMKTTQLKGICSIVSCICRDGGIVPISDVLVAVGQYNLTQVATVGQPTRVDKIIIHPCRNGKRRTIIIILQ